MTTFDPEFFFPAGKINADAATDSRLLQAARVTAHWRAGDMRVMPDFSDSPLFGGDRQAELFSAEPTYCAQCQKAMPAATETGLCSACDGDWQRVECDYCDSIEAMTGTRNCPIHGAKEAA